MIVPCIKGGLMLDASKCAPYGEHDLVMYVSTRTCFKFYDIYDCKTQTQLSITNMLLSKPLQVKEDNLATRMAFYKKHKKVLVARALSDDEYSVFFNSIEAEAIQQLLYKNKFTAKVDILYDDKEITLKELKQKDKKDFRNVCYFIRDLNMIEMLEVSEYEEIKNNVKFPHKAKVIDIALGLVVGIATTLITGFIFRRRRKN